MPTINMDRFTIDDLLETRMEYPSSTDLGSLSFRRRQQVYDDVESSRLIFAMPSLVGYLMGEVARDRSELVTGQTTHWAYHNAVRKLCEHIQAEGGQAFATAEDANERSLLVMQIGRSVLSHDRTWPNYGGGDTDTRGPVGHVVVRTYSSVDVAVQKYDGMGEAIELLAVTSRAA